MVRCVRAPFDTSVTDPIYSSCPDSWRVNRSEVCKPENTARESKTCTTAQYSERTHRSRRICTCSNTYCDRHGPLRAYHFWGLGPQACHCVSKISLTHRTELSCSGVSRTWRSSRFVPSGLFTIYRFKSTMTRADERLTRGEGTKHRDRSYTRNLDERQMVNLSHRWHTHSHWRLRRG